MLSKLDSIAFTALLLTAMVTAIPANTSPTEAGLGEDLAEVLEGVEGLLGDLGL